MLLIAYATRQAIHTTSSQSARKHARMYFKYIF